MAQCHVIRCRMEGTEEWNGYNTLLAGDNVLPYNYLPVGFPDQVLYHLALAPSACTLMHEGGHIVIWADNLHRGTMCCEPSLLFTLVKQQGHTLPRVQLKCAVPLKTYTLQASALFPFDKSDYASMLPQGKEEIRKVAQDIAASKANVDRIEVVGHTDPEGSDMYNQALSQRRADTVRMALSQSQLPGSQIVAHGRGEKQLLVSDCRARFPRDAKQRMACDQPNRRVEITLYGTQQAQPAAN